MLVRVAEKRPLSFSPLTIKIMMAQNTERRLVQLECIGGQRRIIILLSFKYSVGIVTAAEAWESVLTNGESRAGEKLGIEKT